MGRIIGIDYGAMRVGVAVTDPLKIVASGLTTIASEEIFEFLKAYHQKETIEKFVVGDPTDLKGKETHATPLVNKFIQKLKKLFPGIPVVMEDETFTSKMAVQTMVSAGVKKKKRKDKKLIDKVSATLILQSYLERNT